MLPYYNSAVCPAEVRCTSAVGQQSWHSKTGNENRSHMGTRCCFGYLAAATPTCSPSIVLCLCSCERPRAAFGARVGWRARKI
jgi:hypothetical protein